MSIHLSLHLALPALVLALAGALPATADDLDGAQGPEELVHETTEAVRQAVLAMPEELRDDEARLQALFSAHVAPQVDFRRLSRRLLGPGHWEIASDAQRTAVSEEVAKLMARSYSSALAEIVDAEVTHQPVEYLDDGTARVVSDVRVGIGLPVSAIWRLHRDRDRWWVYDLSLGGVSLITTHQRSFAAFLRAGGLDRLIARLEALGDRG